jgi:hypothetical protein
MHGSSFKWFILDRPGISVSVIISLRKIVISFLNIFFQKRLLLMHTQQVALVTTVMVKCSCFHTWTSTTDKGITQQLASSWLLLPGYTNSQPMFATKLASIWSLLLSKGQSKLRLLRLMELVIHPAVLSVLLFRLRKMKRYTWRRVGEIASYCRTYTDGRRSVDFLCTATINTYWRKTS